MKYSQLYPTLKKCINYDDAVIPVDKKSEIRNFSFVSASSAMLSGEKAYQCVVHGSDFNSIDTINPKIEIIDKNMDVPDIHIEENRKFRYHVVKPLNRDTFNEVVLFFHGFNEKYWDKYLPWAKKIADDTGKLVVMFPIAFHMNRAPHLWSDARKMFELSKHRKDTFPDIIDSTLSNVAISTRLHAFPQRFLWSGS